MYGCPHLLNLNAQMLLLQSRYVPESETWKKNIKLSMGEWVNGWMVNSE